MSPMLNGQLEVDVSPESGCAGTVQFFHPVGLFSGWDKFNSTDEQRNSILLCILDIKLNIYGM